MNIAIVIPSYNETKNLKILVKNIFGELPNAKVIIVDDSEKEEYQRLVKAMAKYESRVETVFRGQKLGRGSAVLVGIKKALKDKNIKYIFEMDADLAHDPKEFERFLTKKDGFDLVVGSRYLSQSRIVRWTFWRLIQSRVINFLLNLWLGLSLSDYTNGFRLYSRKAAEFLVDKASLKERGFIALSEMAFKLKRQGFRVGEVPTSFHDRTFGKSNAGPRELLKSLLGAIRIRFS